MASRVPQAGGAEAGGSGDETQIQPDRAELLQDLGQANRIIKIGLRHRSQAGHRSPALRDLERLPGLHPSQVDGKICLSYRTPTRGRFFARLP